MYPHFEQPPSEPTSRYDCIAEHAFGPGTEENENIIECVAIDSTADKKQHIDIFV